jgi:cell division protein FtsB
MGSARLKKTESHSGVEGFVRQHLHVILGLLLLALLVHDVFGTHGFMAMRQKHNDIERVKKDIDRLNSENKELGEQVKSLKTDPRLIEKIAREDLQRARPGEVIIRIPASPQPSSPQSPAKP